MVRPAMSHAWTNGGSHLLYFAIFILFSGIRGCWSVNSEGLALLHFLAKVEFDPFGALKSWDPHDHTPCLWRGVHCLDGKVHMLDLGGQGLEGLLAPELRNLSHLKFLDLSKNKFSGTIPREFRHLTSLEILDLRDNNLTGRIPEELEQLHSLKSLSLSNNNFEGSIPTEIGKLSLQTDVQFHHIPIASALIIGSVNRKFGFWQSVLEQPQRSNSFLGFILFPLKPFQLSKFESKMAQDHADDSRIYLTDLPESSVVENVIAKLSPKRRRLAEESSNLAAIVPPNISNPPPSDPAFTLPSRSSGSFPAIPKPKIPSPAPSSPRTPAKSSPVAVSQSTSGKPEKSSKSIMWILLIVFLLVLAIVVLIICRSRAAKKLSPWKSGLSGQLQKAFVTGVPKLNREELETACEDFSNIINTIDGAATVYKGTLSSGVEIAVVSTAISSLKEWSKGLDLIFRKKIDTLSQVNHKNFLNLIGYCEEDEPFTRMMVFEYAPSGTLSDQLHVQDLDPIDWNSRMRIVMGTAYCLQHMHELNPPVPHVNLTSKDILLTDDNAAKVADMGFWAELVEKANKPLGHQLEHSERLSPAKLQANVHSFGIVLLEIISGKHPYTKEQGHITNWAMPFLNDKDNIKDLVDPTLKSCNEKQLEAVCDVIKSCIQEENQVRPSMKEVVEKLKQATNISPEVATPKLSPLWWAELEILSAEVP